MTTDERKSEQMMLTCDEAIYTMGLIMEIPAWCYFHRGNMYSDLWIFRNTNDRIVTSDRELKGLLLKAKALGWGI